MSRIFSFALPIHFSFFDFSANFYFCLPFPLSSEVTIMTIFSLFLAPGRTTAADDADVADDADDNAAAEKEALLY